MTAAFEVGHMCIHEAHPTIYRRDVVKSILHSDPSLDENSLVLLDCKLLGSSGFMADVFRITFCRKNNNSGLEAKTLIIKVCVCFVSKSESENCRRPHFDEYKLSTKTRLVNLYTFWWVGMSRK